MTNKCECRFFKSLGRYYSKTPANSVADASGSWGRWAGSWPGDVFPSMLLRGLWFGTLAWMFPYIGFLGPEVSSADSGYRNRPKCTGGASIQLILCCHFLGHSIGHRLGNNFHARCKYGRNGMITLWNRNRSNLGKAGTLAPNWRWWPDHPYVIEEKTG